MKDIKRAIHKIITRYDCVIFYRVENIFQLWKIGLCFIMEWVYLLIAFDISVQFTYDLSIATENRQFDNEQSISNEFWSLFREKISCYYWWDGACDGHVWNRALSMVERANVVFGFAKCTCTQMYLNLSILVWNVLVGRVR